jgi:hypothetical protein
VHKHVRDRLPQSEEMGSRVEQGECSGHEVLLEQRGGEHDQVDQDDVPGYGGKGVPPGVSVVVSVVF